MTNSTPRVKKFYDNNKTKCITDKMIIRLELLGRIPTEASIGKYPEILTGEVLFTYGSKYIKSLDDENRKTKIKNKLLRRGVEKRGAGSRGSSGKVSPVGIERGKGSSASPPDSHSCRNEKWRRTTKSTV